MKNLIKMYPCEDRWVKGSNGVVLPEVLLGAWKEGFNLIVIDDKDSMYQLPAEIESRKLEILENKYKDSKIFNQLCIRVADAVCTGNQLILRTERTSYFDSLVTNRAADWKLSDNVNVRDLLCYGPYVPTLKDSKMSNHLGFNGFVITSDNKIGLVKRNGKVSVDKNQYGTMLSASLKAKYALDNNRTLTQAGIYNAIKKEAKDEVGIDVKNPKIIAVYLDMVEGGKPQLLVTAETELRSHEVEKLFNKNATSANVNDMLVDGDYIKWLNIKELNKLKYNSDGIGYDAMNASTIASVKLFSDINN